MSLKTLIDFSATAESTALAKDHTVVDTVDPTPEPMRHQPSNLEFPKVSKLGAFSH